MRYQLLLGMPNAGELFIFFIVFGLGGLFLFKAGQWYQRGKGKR